MATEYDNPDLSNLEDYPEYDNTDLLESDEYLKQQAFDPETSTYDANNAETDQELEPVSTNQVAAPQPQTNELSETEKALQRIFAAKPPAPVLDTDKQYRLRKVSRINGVGKAFGLLADSLSLGLGGNVNKREPDRIAPSLYAAYEGMMDKHKDKTDLYNYREAQRERANAQLSYAVEKDKIQQKYRDDLLKYKYEELKADTEAKRKDAILKQANLDRQYAVDLAKLGDQKQRTNILASKDSKEQDDKGFKLFDDSGNVIKSLGKGEPEKLLALIQNDNNNAHIKELNDDIALLKSEFGGVSRQALEILIAKHWGNSPKARKYLGIEEQSSNPAVPTYIFPQSGQGQAQPQTMSKGEIEGKKVGIPVAPKEDWGKYEE